MQKAEGESLAMQIRIQIEKSRALVVASQVSLSSYVRAAEIRRKMKLERNEQDDRGQSRESSGLPT